jgi:BioD-like phosphotransacetylase family protein
VCLLDFPNAPEGMVSFGNQLQWLEQDLARANQRRDTHPWIIVGGHRPLYCSSWERISFNNKTLANNIVFKKEKNTIFE